MRKTKHTLFYWLAMTCNYFLRYFPYKVVRNAVRNLVNTSPQKAAGTIPGNWNGPRFFYLKIFSKSELTVFFLKQYPHFCNMRMTFTCICRFSALFCSLLNKNTVFEKQMLSNRICKMKHNKEKDGKQRKETRSNEKARKRKY